MAGRFGHLPLVQTDRGRARLDRPSVGSPLTQLNRSNPSKHSSQLSSAADIAKASWLRTLAEVPGPTKDIVAQGLPLLLKLDPGLDLDFLREKFEFEIISEHEDGFVVVAAHDVDLSAFGEMVNSFSEGIHGSARIASIHQLSIDEGQSDRLSRILSDGLLERWSNLRDSEPVVVEMGIGCVGINEIPRAPTRGRRDDDATWARKQQIWNESRAASYAIWDDLKRAREDQIEELVRTYDGQVLAIVDGIVADTGGTPDSFTVRLSISGKGLRDIVLTYPYVFEVTEPDDVSIPGPEIPGGDPDLSIGQVLPPDAEAPAICIVDSGIQEQHVLLSAAIDSGTSVCFIPTLSREDVGDFVRPGGHGTRVAGAALFGESVSKSGSHSSPFWLQNARVLDGANRMPDTMFPPKIIRDVVRQFHFGPKQTRVFNHSVNASGPCRTRHMSAWAAEIDSLSWDFDILLIQSTGNIPDRGPAALSGHLDHIEAGRPYPRYFREPSCRIANPAQSLQALTVGSVGYGLEQELESRTYCNDRGYPSAFTRAGLGIWDVIKPEVVEFGGDLGHVKGSQQTPATANLLATARPELVRSTMFPPGPAYDRDTCGSSFAAPKVARIVGLLQSLLPNEPTLLYRALVAQSARWPTWAEGMLMRMRQDNLDQDRFQAEMDRTANVIRTIGFGIPSEERATSNSDFRATFITAGERQIRADECHIFEVPIPQSLRGPGEEFDIRIDVTLSYSARPRRTRRNLRRYMSTWLSWKSSQLGEGRSDFRARVMKESDDLDEGLPSQSLPWVVGEKVDSGFVGQIRRSSGTLQKDWAVVKSNALPARFCVAVIGHKGWSADPDSVARYSLTVSFEALNPSVQVYEPLRIAVESLQAQVGATGQIEVDVTTT